MKQASHETPFRSMVQSVAALSAAVLSACLSVSFGASLGSTLPASIAIGALALTSDALKIGAANAIPAAMQTERWLRFAGLLLLFAVTTALSVSAAIGVIATNRAQVVQVAQQERAVLERASDARERLLSELRSLGRVEPSTAVRARIEAAETSERWRTTSGCTDATARMSIAFCASLTKDRAAIATSLRAEKIRTEVAAIDRRLGQTQAVEGASAQAMALAQILGVTAEQVSSALTMLLVLTLEAGAAIGLLLNADTRRETPKLHPRGVAKRQRTGPKTCSSDSRQRFAQVHRENAQFERLKASAPNGALTGTQRQIADTLGVSPATANRRLKAWKDKGHIRMRTDLGATMVEFV